MLEGQVRVAGEWVPRSRVAQVYPGGCVEAIVSCVRKALREKDMVIKEVLSTECDQATRRSVHPSGSKRPSDRPSERPSERPRHGLDL